MKFENSIYSLQGLSIEDIAQEYGTPLYVYDADKIIKQLTELKNAFSNHNLKIKYAAKALTNLSILKLLKKHGAGVDVVSIQEANLAILAGFEPKEILFTPNCVSFDEIEAGVDLGLVINIDNISILEYFGQKYHNTVPCCIRINPHIMAGGNLKISTGHVGSKFGISIYQLPHLMSVVNTYKIHVIGLHLHTGSDILEIGRAHV